jgi:hypothetical protein
MKVSLVSAFAMLNLFLISFFRRAIKDKETFGSFCPVAMEDKSEHGLVVEW